MRREDFEMTFCPFSKRILITAALVITASVPAQELVPDPTAPDGLPTPVVKNGFHIYQASGSVGYSSVSGLLGSGSDFRQLGCDCYGVGSVVTGYSHAGPINRFDAVYTPSYTNYYGLTGLRGFNQSLQVVFESRFSPKWKFSFVATADDSSVVEFALQPGTTSVLNPGQDLGSFVNATMTGISPGQSLLYGGRVFSAGGRTGLTYRPTTRFRIAVEGGFFQAQTRSSSSTGVSSGLAQNITYVIPRAQFENVNVNGAYSLTPLSEVGVQLSLLNYHTVVGDYRATIAGGSYARKLSRRWSAFAQAGVGTYTPTSTPAGIRPEIAGSQFTGSFGLGYQGRTSSFLTTYQRMVGDLYGLASSSSQGVQTTWNWHQPGRNWAAYLAVGYQRLSGGPLGDGANWQASAGVSRALSRKTSLNLSYGYLMSSLAPVAVYNNLNAHVVRLTFSWVPVPAQIPGNGGLAGGGPKTTP
jgi:hypothetical protein